MWRLYFIVHNCSKKDLRTKKVFTFKVVVACSFIIRGNAKKVGAKVNSTIYALINQVGAVIKYGNEHYVRVVYVFFFPYLWYIIACYGPRHFLN